MEFNEEGKTLCPDCKGQSSHIVCPTCLGDKYLDWIEVVCGKVDRFGVEIDPDKKTISVATTGKKGGVTIEELYNHLKEKWYEDEFMPYKFPIIKRGGYEIGNGARTMDIYVAEDDEKQEMFGNIKYLGVMDVLKDLKLVKKD